MFGNEFSNASAMIGNDSARLWIMPVLRISYLNYLKDNSINTEATKYDDTQLNDSAMTGNAHPYGIFMTHS